MMKKRVAAVLSAFILSMVLVAGMTAPVQVHADDWDDFEGWEDFDDWDWDDDGYWDDVEDIYAYIIATVDDSEIREGETTVGEASIMSNASYSSLDVKWSSSDSGVASVSGSGNYVHIHGKSDGRATITARLYLEGREVDSDSFSIRVREKDNHISVTGIYVNPTSLNMFVGESRTIDSDVRPEHASDKGIAWTSSNDYVATVGQNGNVYARNAGTATITAKTKENGHTANINVTVYGAGGTRPVENLLLNPTSMTLAIGQFGYITPGISPVDAANKSVSWASSNSAVASITADGKVTGIAPGSAVITCRTADGGKTATCAVNVTNAVAGGAGVPVVPVTAANTRDAMLCYQFTKAILEAPQNGTVAIPASQPMAYDSNVAAAMKGRPDVTVTTAYTFQGHNFVLTLPAGYDLAKHLDASGYVEWTKLSTLQDGVICAMVY